MANTTRTTASNTRNTGLSAILAALPRKLRGTTISGRGVDAPNLALTKSKNGAPLNVQAKVVQKGQRGFANTQKYHNVDATGAVTGQKEIDRDLIAVVMVLDAETGTNTAYVTTVGKIQDLMTEDYNRRIAKNPDKAITSTFYRPTDLGATANDWQLIMDRFDAPAAVAEVEVEAEVAAEPVAETVEDEPVAEAVEEMPEPVMVVAEMPVSEPEVTAEAEAEALAELAF